MRHALRDRKINGHNGENDIEALRDDFLINSP